MRAGTREVRVGQRKVRQRKLTQHVPSPAGEPVLASVMKGVTVVPVRAVAATARMRPVGPRNQLWEGQLRGGGVDHLMDLSQTRRADEQHAQ